MSEDHKPRLSLDEILALVTAAARDPEATPNDRLRALKMLASMESASVTLPPPLTDSEFIERGTRMMRMLGSDIAQLCFRKAFLTTRTDISPAIPIDGLPKDALERANKIVTIKMLYKYYPEAKRTGRPPGYPYKASLAERAEWCQRCALELERFRAQKQLDATPGPDPRPPTEPEEPEAA